LSIGKAGSSGAPPRIACRSQIIEKYKSFKHAESSLRVGFYGDLMPVSPVMPWLGYPHDPGLPEVVSTISTFGPKGAEAGLPEGRISEKI
jgi:hypothetical protein